MFLLTHSLTNHSQPPTSHSPAHPGSSPSFEHHHHHQSLIESSLSLHQYEVFHCSRCRRRGHCRCARHLLSPRVRCKSSPLNMSSHWTPELPEQAVVIPSSLHDRRRGNTADVFSSAPASTTCLASRLPSSAAARTTCFATAGSPTSATVYVTVPTRLVALLRPAL